MKHNYPFLRLKNKLLILACFAAIIPLANADQGGFVNYGGSLTGGSAVASPAGTLTISGANLTFVTTGGTTVINATITTSSTTGGCYGGGRGGHITCSYATVSSFSGTLTANGFTQSINGSTTQYSGTNVTAASGYTGYNSAYTPFYFTDGNARILRSDDLSGTNLIAYGSQGTGVGQFYGPSGIAVDSAGRIYITDTYNDRIVRIDDMNGTNWTSFGSYGSGVGMFTDPQGITIDPAGHIWVLDNGNGRLVRMDDMNGTNWTTLGTAGTGVGQFSTLSTPGFDAQGRIYVADAGNRRIARFDDLNFTNWTTLSQSQPIGPYIYVFGGPTAVVTDPAGKIYVLDGASLVRVDDMTGANWTSLSLGSTPVNTLAIDSTGMIMLAGNSNVQIVDSEYAILTSNLSNVLVQGVYVGVYGAVPLSLPTPRPPAIRVNQTPLTYANQNINTVSASQAVTISNFGGSPLNFSSITANGGFVQTNNCPASLIAGLSCTVNVSFAPAVAGAASGTLTLSDNSNNLGTTQSVSLTGFATQPMAFVVPGSLTFPPQVLNKASAAQSVTVQNTGNGPLQVSASTAAPFTQTNNCAAAIAPADACTISVSFTPVAAGSVTGTLAIATNAGTQSVGLAGAGTSTAAVVTVTPSQLLFPPQLVGAQSPAISVTITNTGKTAVANKTPTITGDFSQTTTCTSSLAAGKSCTVSVKFGPTAVGARTGVLTLNLASGAQTVSLAGTGSNGALPAVLALTPTAVSFTNDYIVGDNPSQTVTVTNTSNASVSIAGIAISGDPSLTQSNKCPSILAAGATCTISVKFVPKTAGTFNSTLTLTEGTGVADVVPVLGVASISGGD